MVRDELTAAVTRWDELSLWELDALLRRFLVQGMQETNRRDREDPERETTLGRLPVITAN